MCHPQKAYLASQTLMLFRVENATHFKPRLFIRKQLVYFAVPTEVRPFEGKNFLRCCLYDAQNKKGSQA
jgi:hypothetical protein